MEPGIVKLFKLTPSTLNSDTLDFYAYVLGVLSNAYLSESTITRIIRSLLRNQVLRNVSNCFRPS